MHTYMCLRGAAGGAGGGGVGPSVCPWCRGVAAGGAGGGSGSISECLMELAVVECLPRPCTSCVENAGSLRLRSSLHRLQGLCRHVSMYVYDGFRERSRCEYMEFRRTLRWEEDKDVFCSSGTCE